MKSKVILIKADEEPVKGFVNLKPNQIYKNVRVSVAEKELKSLAPDEIRVEMIYVGICGTDIHVTTNHPESGYICCTAPLTIPKEGRIIGHEGVGKVLETGSNVRYFSPGMYVTFESIIICYICDTCRKGHFNQCRNAKLLGLEKDGLLGTIVDVPASLAHNITEYVTNDEDLIALACIEPAAVAYVACENSKIKGGDLVVVFGAGPIGVFSAILSKLVFGAAQIYVVEPIEFRRSFAEKWADKVFSPEEFFENCPQNINAVIEASGVLENIEKVFTNIDANGSVILLARSGVPLRINNVDHMITNEISIKGSRGHLCGAFNNILNLYKTRRILLRDIVTMIIDDLDDLKRLLENNEILLNNNCKVLVNLITTKK